MGCLFALFGLITPRVVLFVMWLTGYGGRAFDSVLWPLLGFFFMPYTTCAYALALNSFGGLQGLGLAMLIFGVFFDLAGHGGSGHEVRKRYVYVERR